MNDLLIFKPGDDLYWAGIAELEGVTDWTDIVPTAKIKLASTDGTPGHKTLATCAVTWLDVETGALLVQVPKADTADWPFNSILLIDVKFTMSDGRVITTKTGAFATEKRVTD